MASIEDGAALPEKYVAVWARTLGANLEDVERWVGGEVRLAGLTRSQRAEVIALVDRYRPRLTSPSEGTSA